MGIKMRVILVLKGVTTRSRYRAAASVDHRPLLSQELNLVGESPSA
jgi:hypothetical protein